MHLLIFKDLSNILSDSHLFAKILSFESRSNANDYLEVV